MIKLTPSLLKMIYKHIVEDKMDFTELSNEIFEDNSTIFWNVIVEKKVDGKNYCRSTMVTQECYLWLKRKLDRDYLHTDCGLTFDKTDFSFYGDYDDHGNNPIDDEFFYDNVKKHYKLNISK
jgi:hypothetical protein